MSEIAETPAEANTEVVPETLTPPAETVTKATTETLPIYGKGSMPPRDGIFNASSPKDDWLKLAHFWENLHSEQKSVKPALILPKSQYGAIFKKISQLPEVTVEAVAGDIMAATAEVEPATDLGLETPPEKKEKKPSRIGSFFRRIGRAIRSAFLRLKKRI